MAGEPLSLELAQEAVDALARNDGNKTHAAQELGLGRSTYRARLDVAEKYGLIKVSRPAQQAPPPQQPTKPKVRVRAVTSETPPEGHITRVLCMGDAHDSPDIPDKSRFKWIGQHIKETDPDVFLNIGDSCTFDSLCSYVGNETYNGKLKPPVAADIDSYDKANFTLWNECPNWAGRREKTRGNHEDRLTSFQNRHPEVFGIIEGEYTRVLDRYSVNETPYGQFKFIGGVGFVHTPMTIMGKPYGAGKNALGGIANDATFDIVYGHSHKSGVHRAPKIGPQNYVKVVNLGCALPWGHTEDYAKIATTGWWWGVVELMIQGGHIVSENFIPMTELERRYG